LKATRQRKALGNRVLDFSGVGYRGDTVVSLNRH